MPDQSLAMLDQNLDCIVVSSDAARPIHAVRPDGEAWIVETADKSKVIAKISIQKAPGRTFGGYDFDTGERIAESYADAGKALGKFIRKL